MAVMDEFREERKTIKHGTPQQKLDYFWSYYKWHVIITIATIIAISSFIYNQVTQKETVLYTVLLNSHEAAANGDEAYIQGFADIAGINTDKQQVLLDTSIYLNLDKFDELTDTGIQKMQAYAAAGELDLMAAGQAVFEYCAYQDFLYDLRDILTPEQLERYSSYFFYIDKEVLAAKQEAAYNLDLEEIASITFPDPSKPEEMAEPIPVGIFMNNVSEEFSNNYTFLSDNTAAIGFIVNGKHQDNAKAFLEYIFTAGE